MSWEPTIGLGLRAVPVGFSCLGMLSSFEPMAVLADGTEGRSSPDYTRGVRHKADIHFV